MLLVETYLDFSPGRGIGLFAKSLIEGGSTYWTRNELFDRVFTQDELFRLGKLAADYIAKYGFLETSGNWYLCNDHARFSNHSENPNSKSIFDSKGLVKYNLAVRDIKPNEEIFCNYSEICQASKGLIDFPNL